MRVVVAILSCLGFIGYAGLLMHGPFAGPGSGDGAGHGETTGVFDQLATAYPLAYFVICFLTTFARQRSVSLCAVGVVIHTIWAAIVATMAVKVGPEGAVIFGAIGLFFGFAWLIMYAVLPSRGLSMRSTE
jgi:hypothetical protein